MTEEFNGCLGDGHTEKDYVLSGEMVNELPKLEKQDQIIFEYNQGDSVDCTIYSALGACSDLCNIELTQEQIDEAVEESFKHDRVKGKGWYIKDAVSLACDMFKKRYNKNLVYYRVDNFNDSEIQSITEKNYTLCTGFNGNSKYKKDRRDNGRIDGKDFGPSTYGHAVGLIRREEKNFVKDNYKGRKENGYYTNIYEIVPPISELKASGTWQNFSYLIVEVEDEKEKDIKRLNEMKNQIDRMIEDNSKMYNLTTEEQYKTTLHLMNEWNRKKKGDIERELSKYFKS